jgi:protein TonB
MTFLRKYCLIMLLAFPGFALQTLQAQDKPEQVYTIVEQMPEFPGGMPELMKFLAQNIKYPREAQKAKIEGTVFVNFIVTQEGKTDEIIVVKGIGKACDEEAIRVIAIMPPWKPGIKDGKEVAVRFTLPIRFQTVIMRAR